MSAKKKLLEAEFFLEKLRDSSQALPQDLQRQWESHCYLSAFLSAAVSVIDYLLEDYNTKFSLNIPLADKQFRKTFEREAKRTGNQAALDFLDWWRGEREALEKKDPIGRLLIGKRHIDIHRVETKPDLAKVGMSGTIPISGSLVAKLIVDGEVVETRTSPDQAPVEPEVRETTFDWFFSEYPDEPVITVCDKFLDMVGSFVSEAEKRFP